MLDSVEPRFCTAAEAQIGLLIQVEPGTDGPRCSSTAYLPLFHDPTGQFEGTECVTCGYEENKHSRPLDEAAP